MSATAGTGLGFVTWDRDDPTGGNVYNRALVAELRALGVTLRLHRLAGPWPEGDASSHLKLARALRAEPACIVDGIVGSGSPEVVAAAVDSGHVVTVLIPLPICDEVGLDPMQRQRYTALEAKTVQAASGVLCSSRWSAAELRRRYGHSDVGVAIPGVTPAPVAPGSQDSGPPRIVSVATLTPTKDQLTLVHALARLADLQWTADLVGSDQADPDYANRLRAEIVVAGLQDRILVPGAVAGSVLDQKWDAADLRVLPSRVETYGLVVV